MLCGFVVRQLKGEVECTIGVELSNLNRIASAGCKINLF